MWNILNYIVLLVVALSQVACFGGDDSMAAEDVVVVENRLYGVLSDPYTIDTYNVKSGETMGNILSRHGLSARGIYDLEQAAKGVYPLNRIGVGKKYVTFTKCDSLGTRKLDYLAYEITPVDYALFAMVGDSMAAYRGTKSTTAKRHMQTAEIESSMWVAASNAGMPNELSHKIEDIFQWTVDFFTIRKGDSFTVIYDEMFVDDTISIGLGRVWGARFTHGKEEHFAIPFKQSDELQYWELDGGSLRKQMLKAPLKYSRISSGFSLSRLHPIHKVYKPHTGVDYAAPLGTEVHSVADGVVIFKGWGGGGGNTLKIKHAGGFTTGYLHLNAYAKNIAVGSTVKQGQTIGFVGSTGDSTGPHLDYRVWKGSTPVNPLTMPQKPTEPIAEENRAQFEYVKQRIVAELNGEAVEECDYITNLDDLPQFNTPQVDTVIFAHIR